MRLQSSVHVSLSMFQVAIAVPMALQLVLVMTQRLDAVDGVGVERSDHQHLHSDSFPRNDEYDMMALEPETPFGTPYGGFSRATASRLASLPLKLPSSIDKEVDESNTVFEPMYTTVRDNSGRAYACRVYHEDELEAYSLGDSMFDTPILKKKSDSNSNSNSNSNTPSSSKQQDTPSSSKQQEEQQQQQQNENDEENIPADTTDMLDEGLVNFDIHGVKNLDIHAHTNIDTRGGHRKLDANLLLKLGLDPVILGHTIHQRFTKLTGLCAQLHPDWWSYEWCHQEMVKQFHVKLSTNSNNKVQSYELEDITSLGSYSRRTIEVATKDDESDDDTNDNKADTIDLAQERKEIGRVVDTFIGGGTCPETGKPRVTEATFRCCSERNIAKTKGGVLKNGNKVDTDIVTIFQATEWKEAVCHYNITLCTPLLCDDYDDGEDGTDKTTNTKTKSPNTFLEKILRNTMDGNKNNNKRLNLQLDPAEAEKMSVVEILEQTFGKDGNFCVRLQTAGWWAYEFCPGDYIRQYHEETHLTEQIAGTTTVKKGTTPGITEHVLGRFVPEDHKGVTKENEWKHVVSATKNGSSPLGGASKFKSSSTNSNSNNDNKKNHKSPSSPSTSAGGNGAYYFQEYTKGDLCDHEDVTDSAIKAGEFGEGGIERAITVRYSCNSELTITVKEDSTCHYVVDITVPTLCHHPLFKAPVAKKQVVKCLPIT